MTSLSKLPNIAVAGLDFYHKGTNMTKICRDETHLKTYCRVKPDYRHSLKRYNHGLLDKNLATFALQKASKQQPISTKQWKTIPPKTPSTA